MRFSIVVPVYNTEKYLKNSLDCIISQTYKDFEVIIVNDGSTDNSLYIINDYVEKYDFKVINKKNNGCYAARVDGIINSNGEYIINLDSDDCFSSNSVLEDINRKLSENNNPDILIYGYNEMSDNNCLIKTNKHKFNCFIDNGCSEFYKTFFGTNEYNSIWSKVFKKELFNVNQIIEKRIDMCDDVLITLNIIEAASSIVCVDDVFYNYRINPTSIVRQYKKSELINVLVYNKMVEFMDRKKLSKEYLDIISRRLLKDCAVTYLLAPNNINKKMSYYKTDLLEISSNSIYKNVCYEYLNQQSFNIRFINKLILDKKIRVLVFFKRILQIKGINKFMRKLYGKA